MLRLDSVCRFRRYRVDSIGVVERSSRIEWFCGAFPGMEGVDSGDRCAASGPSGGERLLELSRVSSR